MLNSISRTRPRANKKYYSFVLIKMRAGAPPNGNRIAVKFAPCSNNNLTLLRAYSTDQTDTSFITQFHTFAVCEIPGHEHAHSF